MNEIKVPENLYLYSLARKKAKELEQEGTSITVCCGTGCRASGSMAAVESLKQELERKNLSDQVHVRITGCHGFCEQGSMLIIEPGNLFYCRVQPKDIPEIVDETITKKNVITRLQYVDPTSGEKVVREEDIPFYKFQDRAILGKNKLIDPCDIEEYIAYGGYTAFVKAITQMKPEEVIEEIGRSGLRGRGGAGFPTARKWEETRRSPGTEKYVVCNADEGDPGAYMDRSVLEGNPHAIIEGMLIAAYAIGAEKGYIYVRNEYPLAVTHTRIAVEQARQLSLLGKNILGSGLNFDIEIARGGGAFVCGESSALMASLEGKVGEPRPKDIHAAEKGLKDFPSALNNVETLANVPVIINNGSAWFAAKGTEESKGTKIFALTGQIKNTGLVEVPMGTPLSTIIYDIGGGSKNGAKIKAVQTGGPSGGCLPVEKFHLPVDYEALTEAGSMVGSGGMVVMDEHSCMVDVAKYFLTFLQDESCGKCVPCRIGIDRMLEVITDITKGKGTREQLELLEDVAETVAVGSLCALGKTAPNPVLSTLRYFRSEYEAHIDEKRCPAGVCRELIHYSIDSEKCIGCGLCLKACPHSAITGEIKKPHVIDGAVCSKCGICMDQCKSDAVLIN